MYLGGYSHASDGMDAIPTFRRNSAFHIYLTDYDVANQIMKLIFDANDNEPYVSEGAFPGIFCHNHLFNYLNTPRKDDWSTLCNPEDADFSEDQCLSLQEASFGSSLERLRNIHSEIDPLRLFDTNDGVGF